MACIVYLMDYEGHRGLWYHDAHNKRCVSPGRGDPLVVTWSSSHGPAMPTARMSAVAAKRPSQKKKEKKKKEQKREEREEKKKRSSKERAGRASLSLAVRRTPYAARRTTHDARSVKVSHAKA